MNKQKFVFLLLLGFLLLIISGALIALPFILPQSPDYKHETDRWAVIEDVQGNRMAVEPIDNNVWEQLVNLYNNESRYFVGSIIEEYDNTWGFRLKPENVTVAKYTAEGLQGTIRYISENLDYWLGGWGYIGSYVVEIHEP
jgi:hypothetical protein